jgi:hypothetical protein
MPLCLSWGNIEANIGQPDKLIFVEQDEVIP